MSVTGHIKRYTFSFRERLSRQKDFSRVFTSGRKATHPALCIYVYVNTPPVKDAVRRLGLVTSRKVGIAADRNRVKRRLREIFRTSKFSLAPGCDVVAVPRKPAVALSFEELRTVFMALLERAAVYHKDAGVL